jgi:hypothetical protein
MYIIGRKSKNADREKMPNLDPQTIRTFDSRSLLGSLENTGDLLSSFYGYYYF